MKVKIYALYDQKEILLLTGTLQEVANYLNRNINSLQSAISHQKQKSKDLEYYIIRYHYNEWYLYNLGYENINDDIEQVIHHNKYNIYKYNLYDTNNNLVLKNVNAAAIKAYTNSNCIKSFYNKNSKVYSNKSTVKLSRQLKGYILERVERVAV